MSYLLHHGIKGQKWGVRNGPPYPLDKGNNKRQKSDEQNNNSKLVKKGKDFVGKRERSGDLTVAYAAAFALSYIGARFALSSLFYTLGRKADKKTLNKDYSERSVNKLSEVPKLNPPPKSSESMKVTNPNFPKEGFTGNCARCAIAMTMREKGYDVKANMGNPMFLDIVVEKTFKNAKTVTLSHFFQTQDEIVKKFEKEGDGAYGVMGVQWRMGGGHALFWKNENGKLHIYDGQCGEEYNVDDLFRSARTDYVDYARLDNCDPKEEVLAVVELR